MRLDAYVILINFSNHIFQVNVLNAEFLTGLLKFILRDVTATVLVEVLESCKEVIFPLSFVQMKCCCYELAIVDAAIVVEISLCFEIGTVS